jgi:hypothetical protein
MTEPIAKSPVAASANDDGSGVAVNVICETRVGTNGPVSSAGDQRTCPEIASDAAC